MRVFTTSGGMFLGSYGKEGQWEEWPRTMLLHRFISTMGMRAQWFLFVPLVFVGGDLLVEDSSAAVGGQTSGCIDGRSRNSLLVHGLL
jgi:hypothetical protein